MHAPTPLEPLANLSQSLGGPRIYVKRDDCTGFALGGNKTRKLEFLLGQAIADGATTIITEGGLQSSHVRLTAAASAKAGLKCELVLVRNVPIESRVYETSGNLFLDRLFNATIHLCEEGQPRNERSRDILEAARARGESPYHIPVGGSNPLGTLGYVEAATEIAEQGRDLSISIDHVITATGSGATQAGMIVGFQSLGGQTNVLGVGVDNTPLSALAKVRELAEMSQQLLNVNTIIPDTAFAIAEGYGEPGYGLPSDKVREALRLVATTEGLILDPVYTGKAMAALVDLIRNGHFTETDTVVFLHTGGQPALFAYSEVL